MSLNLIMERIDDFAPGGRLDRGSIEAHAADLIERYQIKARPNDRVATLSGGNIQKVLLARVLSRDPRVIVGVTADPRPRCGRQRVRARGAAGTTP